jgi:hypothetical protein
MMFNFSEKRLEAHLSSVLEAVGKGDRGSLQQLGQKGGFVHNRIRKLVWYPLN